VELDGGHHLSRKQYDHERTVWLRNRGYVVLRFWNNDVMTKTDFVVETIRKSLLSPTAPSP
jgi:very-short-patch-repair endonuclease